jgi:hypothetical protein
VGFFGTAAVGVLVDASTDRPDLRVVCSKMISRVLKVMGLGNWFSVNSSVTAALEVEDR